MLVTAEPNKLVQDFVYCPENGVSVGMQYEKTNGPLEVKLAVTFCQDHVSLNKKEARNVLKDRLKQAKFEEIGYCSNKYTCLVIYDGRSPKKELLLPFLRYISNLLVTYKNVKTLLVPQNILHSDKTNFYVNRVTSFTGQKVAEKELSVEQAQELSVCQTANIEIRGHKQVVWVKGQPTALTKCPVEKEKEKKTFVFKPLSEKVSKRLRKMSGWKPVFPKETSDTETKLQASTPTRILGLPIR